MENENVLMQGTTELMGCSAQQYLSSNDATQLLKPKDTPKEKIKLLDTGFGKKLKYVSGSTVINSTNETFGTWDFEVISSHIIECIPKPRKVYDSATKKQVPVIDKDGNPIMDYQAPFVSVHGRLTVYYDNKKIGSRDSFGSQGLMGGQSEQESAFKSAATDCLKKCASLFGIHLDLYESDEDTANRKKVEEAEVQKAIEAAKPKYKKEDLEEIAKIKAILNITTNEALNDKVADFLKEPTATHKDLNPLNMADFCKFMRTNYIEV